MSFCTIQQVMERCVSACSRSVSFISVHSRMPCFVSLDCCPSAADSVSSEALGLSVLMGCIPMKPGPQVPC